MQKYRIINVEEKDDLDGKPLYWSNEYGWTSWNWDKFTGEESDNVDLPIGGRWERAGLDVTLVGEVDPVYVGVYEVGRAYGGAEEGGWWYDCGELVKVVICSSEDEAIEIRENLMEEYPNTGKRYSVLGGEDYNIWIAEDFPEPYFPDVTPHYE